MSILAQVPPIAAAQAAAARENRIQSRSSTPTRPQLPDHTMIADIEFELEGSKSNGNRKISNNEDNKAFRAREKRSKFLQKALHVPLQVPGAAFASPPEKDGLEKFQVTTPRGSKVWATGVFEDVVVDSPRTDPPPRITLQNRYISLIFLKTQTADRMIPDVTVHL